MGYHRNHPRVCGEHLVYCQYDPLVRGSSPRMRGAQMKKPGRFLIGRIIPAYAGSTR